jgi:hypothetical protein
VPSRDNSPITSKELNNCDMIGEGEGEGKGEGKNIN